MRRALHALLGVLFPAACRSCGRGLGADERFFCSGCISGIKRVGGALCGVCGEPFPSGAGISRTCSGCCARPPSYDAARAEAFYEGALREAVHLFKYGGVRGLSGLLGGLAADGARRWFPAAEVAVPVPLHPHRLRERGFNQSAFLARAAAGAVGAALSLDGLLRTRRTRPQVELGPKEREENVRGAFAAARPEDFRGRAVMLVDDVYTTGATVRECARVLKSAGAESVLVLTVARVADGQSGGEK